MDIELFKVLSEITLYELGHSTVSMLRSKLSAFEKEVDRCEYPTNILFFSEYHDSLRRVHHFLDTTSKRYPELRCFVDRLFVKKLKFKRGMPIGLSRQMGEFVKGITYFSHQIGTQVPIYHRINACGPGDASFRSTMLTCVQGMDKVLRNEIKTRVETCYIERLIYDCMYKEQTLHFLGVGTEYNQQDQGHRFWLEQTQKDFMTCFPNLHIDVSIEYENIIPIKIAITRSIRGVFSSEETYTKSVMSGTQSYNSAVYCHKRTADRQYVKVQGFARPMQWQKL